MRARSPRRAADRVRTDGRRVREGAEGDTRRTRQGQGEAEGRPAISRGQGQAHGREGREAGHPIKTLNGQSLKVRLSHGTVTVGGARVITADVGALNGVIHVVNEVLIPR